MMPKEIAARKAKAICEKYDVKTYPVNIVSICENEGITVFEEYLPEEVSGFIVIQEENFMNYGTGHVIVVNRLDSARRRRFTIAHELAHFLLHKTEESPLFAHRDAGQNGGIETEANFCASNVLMPENLVKQVVKQVYRKYNGYPPSYIITEEVADAFVVSKPAVEVRLNQLGII